MIQIPLNFIPSLCYTCDTVFYLFSIYLGDRIGGVIVSVLASSAVDCWFETRSGQTKDYKIVTSMQITQHLGVKSKTGWLGIRILCPNGAASLPAVCYVSGLAL